MTVNLSLFSPYFQLADSAGSLLPQTRAALIPISVAMGQAPYQVYGKLQVNAIIPDNIGSGLQPLVLRVGDTDNARQEVTVAVQ